MIDTIQNEYHPDYVSPPGETLLETLEAVGMSQSELATRINCTIKTINEIIQAKVAITSEIALQLERTLRVPTYFWLKREQRYRESLARLAQDPRLASWTTWLNAIPIEEMMGRGWLPTRSDLSQQVFEALKFFGVSCPDAWQAIFVDGQTVRYRQSPTLQSHLGTVSAWLRQGELKSQEIDYVAPYNAEAFRDALSSIRALTRQPVHTFQHHVVNFCAKAGVAVVFVPELPHLGISGATQWLAATQGKALIELTLSYQTDDQLWLTFFHEASHLLLHADQEAFLDLDSKGHEKEEDEADTFASDLLIPPPQWQAFLSQGFSHSKAQVEQFAQELGIAPSIVVARLQHEQLLPCDQYNDLKRPLRWSFADESSTAQATLGGNFYATSNP